LIFGAVLGGILVGIGIIWEAKKFDAATATVFVGIVIEAVCTIFLFVTDEGISRTQQLKIAGLELKLLSRSVLVAEHEAAIIKYLAPFGGTKFEIGIDLGSSEQNALAHSLDNLLVTKLGWIRVDWNPPFTIPTWIFGAGSGTTHPSWASVIATNLNSMYFPNTGNN